MAIKLKQMIKNEMEKDKTLAKRITKLIGYANPSTLYKFLNNEKRDFEEFNTMLIVIRELFPEQEKELMMEIAKTLDPNKFNTRVALEYATITKHEELKRYLIEKLAGAKNIESKDFAFIYELDDKLAKKEISSHKGIELINRKGFTSYEAKVFSRIVLIHEYWEIGLFDIMFDLAKLTNLDLQSIEDNYLAKQYKARFGLIMSVAYLHKGMIEESRENANNVLNSDVSESVKAMTYLNLGNSYIIENYNTSFQYLQKGLELAEKFNLLNAQVQIKRSMNFLMNYWGHNPIYLDKTSKEIPDKHEVAFMHIRKNNVKEALKILDSINQNEMSNVQKGFHYFYRGLIANSKEFFYQSITYFKMSGDSFYRQLPIIELKKMGENELLLNALSV
jgi:tetratricopeptide (TPR) repeat protein